MSIEGVLKAAETPTYNLKPINDAFDISLKAKELRDAGLLHSGTELMTQAAALGEFMWEALWKHATENGHLLKVRKPDIERGEQIVVK